MSRKVEHQKIIGGMWKAGQSILVSTFSDGVEIVTRETEDDEEDEVTGRVFLYWEEWFKVVNFIKEVKQNE